MDHLVISSFDSFNNFGYHLNHTMLYAMISVMFLSILALAAAPGICSAASPTDILKSTAPAAPADVTKSLIPAVLAPEKAERNSTLNQELDAQGEVSEPAINSEISGESTDTLPTTEGKWLRASNSKSIYFAYGSTQLTESAMEWIKRHAERLRANRRLTVTLYGYTDDYSSSSYSVALGTSRANVVRDQLISLDVSPHQIRVTSYGHDKSTTAPCLTERCRTSCRRVEFRYADVKNSN
ncbi:MAG: OmpA family protein [Sterolibacterium sp.]